MFKLKVLVTGGAGFIGSHVVDEYIKQGHEVVVIDNLTTGKLENLNPDAKFYNIDIRDEKVEEIFKTHNFDVVNNHAAQMNVRVSVENPILDAEINVLGLINLLKNCVKYKVKKFIDVSSGGVIYAPDASFPLIEDSKKGPISPYGITKLTGERYVEFFSKTYGLKFSALRYSNVYGPRQNPKGEAGVISIFATSMLNNEQPIIFGDGTQIRDYVYVKDVVAANVAVLTKGDNEAFNIGTGIETDVNGIFKVLKDTIEFDNDAKHIDAKPGDLQRNVLDNSKAKTILDWTPSFMLTEGLKETVEWFRSKA